MNWKAVIMCVALFGSALTARAFYPITFKEIAMLLRNGEKQQFIIDDTARRKLLQPLSAQEEKDLVSIGATPDLLNALRDPAMIATPQAASDYRASVQQRELLARKQQQQEEMREAQAAAMMRIKQQQPQSELRAKPEANEIEGKPLDLKFTASDGSSIDLANLRGKVVLIDFWATWCRPCMGEVPNVVAAYNKYHDRGLEIIGISLDKSKEAMLKTTKENGMTWPQYFDGKGSKNEISSALNVHEIPTMWLVNKRGFVATTEVRGKFDAEVERLLSE